MNRRNFITRALAFLGGCVGLGSYTKAGLHFEYDWANSVFMGQPKPNGNPLRETVEAPSSFMHVFRSLPMPCGHRAWRPVEQRTFSYSHRGEHTNNEWRHFEAADTKVRCVTCGDNHHNRAVAAVPEYLALNPLVDLSWKAEAES